MGLILRGHGPDQELSLGIAAFAVHVLSRRTQCALMYDRERPTTKMVHVRWVLMVILEGLSGSSVENLVSNVRGKQTPP